MSEKVVIRFFFFFIITSLFHLLSGCSGFSTIPLGKYSSDQCSRADQPQRDWTILVYLNADNDLDEFISNRLQKIKTAVYGKNINIIVQFDGNLSNDSKRFYLRKNKKATVVKHIPCEQHIEYDMLNPNTLAAFIAWGIKNFPSKRTAVIIAGHGMGILNLPKRSSRSILSRLGFQQIPNEHFSYDRFWYHMDVEIMTSKIIKVLNKYNDGEKIDLLAFDSCQMGNFETLMTITPIAKYTIASEYPITYKTSALKRDNAYGLPIDSIIYNLSRYPHNKIPDTLHRVIESFDTFHKDFGFYHSESGNIYYPESSLALYDMSYSPTIKKYVKKMIEEFMNQADRKPELFEALFMELLKSHAVCHPVGYLDLMYFVEMIYRVSGLKSAKDLHVQLNDKNCFISEKSIRHTISDQPPSGVSIFFPNNLVAGQHYVLKELYPIYAKFNITKEVGSNRLLKKYLNATELKRTGILTRIVNNYVNHDIKIQFEPSEGKYDELYLFTLTEISLYPLLRKSDYTTVMAYLKMVGKSDYKSVYFTKHKKDLRMYLERLKIKEIDHARKARLKELTKLITHMNE